MLSAFDVARYFLTLADTDAGDLISNMKLQKLCYYAQGYHLAIFDEPLFNESVEAWTHGPVVPSVYHEYKVYESEGIPSPDGLDEEKYDEQTREFLDEVWLVFGQYSAWKLRNMTHQEAPWKNAHESGKTIITREALSNYFKDFVVDGEEQEEI